eukprot:484972-Rhodomonas_salina.1
MSISIVRRSRGPTSLAPINLALPQCEQVSPFLRLLKLLKICVADPRLTQRFYGRFERGDHSGRVLISGSLGFNSAVGQARRHAASSISTGVACISGLFLQVRITSLHPNAMQIIRRDNHSCLWHGNSERSHSITSESSGQPEKVCNRLRQRKRISGVLEQNIPT